MDLLWICEGYAQPHQQERLLPTGAMDLVFTMDQHGGLRSNVSGARSEAVFLDTSAPFSAIGVRFKPGGGFPFFNVPAGNLQNLNAPLDIFWGAKAVATCDELWSAKSPEVRFHVLECSLLEMAIGQFEGHRAVHQALKSIRASQGACSVGRLVEQLGLSSRKFIEVFRNEVGLPPKLFCRIQRFREVLRRLDRVPSLNWTEIAVSRGYFDQAHFIHDFRAFSGVNPTTYVLRRTSRYHVSVADESDIG